MFAGRLASSAILCLVFMASGLSWATVATAGDWPQWRGPRGDGTSDEKQLPTHWSSTENVAWKVPLPEAGNSTPVVSGNRVFITQAEGNSRTLLCFDRVTGNRLWRAATEWTQPDPTHSTNPHCASSPATDGKRVIAWFGSAGLFCYDMDGNQLWKRDLGIQKHIWGYGSSPIIHRNLCYLNFGPGERAFLIACDIESGETAWQHDEPINRDGIPEAPFASADFYGSWSTPVIRTVAGREELLLSFPFRICAFEPASGKMLWFHQGLNALVYTSPLVTDDLIVAMGGYSGIALALRVPGDSSGEIPQASRMWRHAKTKQRIGSGAIYEGHIYVHNDPGIAECFELASGKLVWEKRLSGKGSKNTNWSSVMIADGLCYTLTQGGDCFVFRASPEFELISTNALGESSNASVVASQGQLFLRTDQHLWCIGK